jgi:hypothetical protein
MKNWFNKNYKTLIIAAFLIPILTVAVVSISHVTQWYGISNPVSWSVYLSIGIEIAALSALAAISANMGSKVYFPFAIVTLIQFIGNIFFAYSFIDINSKQFKDWVDLVSPLVEFIGVDNNDFVGHKRFLALFAGGMLPIISLSFLHMLVKFTEEDRMKGVESTIDEKLINEVDAKEIIGEVSRLRLSDEDLEILTKHLENPSKPNEALIKAANEYKKRNELLSEMMKNDEELGLYDEPFDNPLIKEDVIEPQTEPEVIETVNEVVEIPNEEIIENNQIVEEEEIFQEEPTIEEERQNFSIIDPNVTNIFQQEPTPSLSDEEIMEMNQDEYERKLENDDFDGFVPEPFATPEEVEEFGIDVKIINEVLDEVNNEIDAEQTEVPQYDLEMVNDEPVYQSEQKELDEANDILDNIEEPLSEMVIQEPVQPEVVETKIEEAPSEDESIKKNS